MNSKYQPLFKPIGLRSGVQIKNRIVMAPMTNWSSNEDGSISDLELDYYAHRSKGVGVVITACAYVTPNGKGFSGEIGVDRDELIPGLQRLATTIQKQGAKAVLQIYHGGSKCPPELVPNGVTVSASSVILDDSNGDSLYRKKLHEERLKFPPPLALTNDEVNEIIIAFVEATRRAIQAGFDGVEVHAANGYLPQQFFSPFTNIRMDKWGGTLEKRMTFHLELIERLKQVIKEYATHPFLLGYRISPEEPTTPGITMDETLELVDALVEKAPDYLHISIKDYKSMPRRGIESDNTRSRIELIVERVGNKVPIIGVGSIITPDDAIDALNTGISFVAMARELIIEPDWVEKVERGQEADIKTMLTMEDRGRLLIPMPLWRNITETTGWFPIAQSK